MFASPKLTTIPLLLLFGFFPTNFVSSSSSSSSLSSCEDILDTLPAPIQNCTDLIQIVSCESIMLGLNVSHLCPQTCDMCDKDFHENRNSTSSDSSSSSSTGIDQEETTTFNDVHTTKMLQEESNTAHSSTVQISSSAIIGIAVTIIMLPL